MKYFSENLRKYRKIKGLSQKDLAEKIGVKANTISNYESEVSEPDIKTITLLAQILEVPINDLILFKEDSRNLIFDPKPSQMVQEPTAEYKSAPVSDLTRALSIIESQQESLQKMSEAALLQAQTMARLVDRLETAPNQTSKAG